MKEKQATKSNQKSLMERMDTFNDEEDHFDPFSNFFKEVPRLRSGAFSDLFNQGSDMDHFEHHFKSQNTNAPGTMISKSYVSKVRYNENGEPERETYQSQSVNQTNEDGNTMKEKKEAYHNSGTGIEKTSRQRVLDGKGHKCIQERNKNTGDQNEHNMFKGMEEKDLEDFNTYYDQHRQKINFQKNYDLIDQMNYSNRGRLGQQSRRETNRNNNLLGNDYFRAKF